MTTALPETLLAELGPVFARFGPPEQDSGNRSWGVDASTRALRAAGVRLPARSPDRLRLFVKSAGDPREVAALPHELRVRLLRRSARLLRRRHPALPRCHGTLASGHGPLLLLDWRAGELLRVPAEARGSEVDPAVRLRLDMRALERCIDELLDVHAHLARHGWVVGDLYDGSVLVDPATGAVTLVDVDLYRLGASRNDRGRMFGSTRFMAPEEFERGARLDHRTSVFVLGRLVAHLCGEEYLAARSARAELVSRATAALPEQRYRDPVALLAAWRERRGDCR